MAATYGDNADVLSTPNKTLDETQWNTSSSPTYSPYSYSKVAAERAAWEMSRAAQGKWTLAVVNPGLVFGPGAMPGFGAAGSASGSLHMLERLFLGGERMGATDLGFPLVDVREVALAHAIIGEKSELEGRFIVSEDHTTSMLEIANLVRPVHTRPALLPTRNMPKVVVTTVGPLLQGIPRKWLQNNVGLPFKVDNSRSVKELGIVYRPTAEMVKDHYESWVAQQDGN